MSTILDTEVITPEAPLDIQSTETVSIEAPLDIQKKFIAQIANANAAIQLFSYINDVYFFMKDHQGRFIAANALQLEKLGATHEEQIIGKTDYDFFPKQMVEHYLRDDAFIIETGRPLEKKVELVSNPDGTVDWYTTSKVPIKDHNNNTIGIMGFRRNILNKSTDKWTPFQQMGPVLNFIRENYSQRFEIKALADIVNLSLSQFEKRFRAAFDVSPKRFVTRYRITRACHELSSTTKPITKISVEIGFYDHSHFSREFKSVMGMYPGEYRKRNKKHS